MITFKEILGNVTVNDVSIKEQQNIEELLKRVNKLRQFWGKPMIVTSGYRTMQDHLRIYSQKGITDKKLIPMQSKHLQGLAVDFADPKGALYDYLLLDPQVLEECDLWAESGTKGWVHVQCVPFASYKPGGTRWFKP